jgi:micrococcal nuclease
MQMAWMNLKLFPLTLTLVLVLALISGCIGGQDTTSIFKAMPEVQQFMKEHPNAKITVTYWSKEEVAQSLQEISQQCGKSITPAAMYKAIISETDLKIVLWIDAENKIIICSSTESLQTLIPTPAPTTTQATPFVTPFITPTRSTPIPKPTPKSGLCRGLALCITDNVKYIVDGDTIDIGSYRVRLVLIDAPETNNVGYTEAKEKLASLCPVGSVATVDQDDIQLLDRYDRLLGVVYCNSQNVNEELIRSGVASLYSYYCSKSEFGTSSWAVSLGCGSIALTPTPTYTSTPTPYTSTPTPKTECDPSYPTVCIPPPPPDLDCKDISYRNFKVLPPDPHRFDGDKDGVGCET